MNGFENKKSPVGRGLSIASLAVLVFGVVLLVIGIIYYNNTDMSKYYKLTDVDRNVDAGSINDVKISCPAGKLTIGRSSDSQIHISGSAPEELVISTDGKLDIKVDSDFGFDLGLVSWDKSGFGSCDLTVLLPDKTYETFKLEGGAGEVVVEDLSCKDADIDFGAGELNIKGINVKNELTLDGGVGDINITDAYTGGLDFDCGVGEVDFAGRVEGDIDIDCGVGSCNVSLANPRSDFGSGGKYSIKTDSGVGRIKITYGNDEPEQKTKETTDQQSAPDSGRGFIVNAIEIAAL